MPAHIVYDYASLGSVIRYFDSRNRQAVHKKLAAWESCHGLGRLVKKEPPRELPTYSLPACFRNNAAFDLISVVPRLRTASRKPSFPARPPVGIIWGCLRTFC